MVYNFIEGQVVLAHIDDRFNIQNSEWVARAPKWILDSLGEFNSILVLQIKKETKTVSSHRIQLPCNIKLLGGIVKDGIRLTRKGNLTSNFYTESFNSQYLTVNSTATYTTKKIETYRQELIIQGYVSGTAEFEEKLREYAESFSSDIAYTNTILPLESGDDYSYSLNHSGWAFFPFATGTVDIYYYTPPTSIDSNYGINFPMIPDVQYVTEAIAWYCFRNLLGRGYKHHTFNYADADNQWLKYKRLAESELGAMDSDAREQVREILTDYFDNPYYHFNEGL